MSAKQKIPKALREQVWIVHAGKVFERKCLTDWCNNTMTVFDFQCGHNIPESAGGPTILDNLVPICGRCNLSMSDNYTFDRWCSVFNPHIVSNTKSCCFLPWCVYSSPIDRNASATATARTGGAATARTGGAATATTAATRGRPSSS